MLPRTAQTCRPPLTPLLWPPSPFVPRTLTRLMTCRSAWPLPRPQPCTEPPRLPTRPQSRLQPSPAGSQATPLSLSPPRPYPPSLLLWPLQQPL